MQKLPLKCAISPCPNDTYLFHAWIKGCIETPFPLNPFYADIEQLNGWAIEGRYPLTKLSFALLKKLSGIYRLLPVGAAIGKNVGPLLVAAKPYTIKDLSKLKIAFPGEWTTAHLLYQKLLPEPQEKIFCQYNQIYELLEEGLVEAGVIIHEGRFTFEERGFYEVADLGELWRTKTQGDIPLGGLAVRDDVLPEVEQQIIDTLQKSYDFAKQNPQASLPFILEHAQEMNPKVIRSHIDLYVNDQTRLLSSSSRQAIDFLISS